MFAQLDRILPRVEKPARYTGGEFNSIRKDYACVDVRFALAFPDVYEIGMSNLGLRILYDSLNKRSDVAAERVFAPWVDMEVEMRRNSVPLFALESGTPAGEFDIIGFSLGYELTYTNVLNMLDLAGIPVLSEDRGDKHPLVIAGGCCTVNPEPLADFIDAFAIGEGEELVHEIVEVFKRNRCKGRARLLRALASVPGIYVPSLYEITYNDDWKVSDVRPKEAGVPARVRRRIVAELDSADYPTRPVMPFIETVHDRIPLEVMRGCSRGCRFCQAGFTYRPVRQRSQEKLMSQAQELVANTGYDEISLLSLSTADYKGIESLVRDLIAKYESDRIGLSLPSLRADAPCVELASEIQKVRKSGLTLAPEAGTQRVRDVINKNVTEGDLLSAVEAAFRYGWKRIKLYFMIGLPGESDEDIVGIAHLAGKVSKMGRRMGIKPVVNLSVACFVPKAHTPFQWRAQESIEELERKQEVLKNALRNKHVELSWHDARISRLEAILARGDRRLCRALHLAWQKGCRFDAWDDQLDYEKWMQSIEEAGLDAAFYANRPRPYTEVLPWDHIDCGVTKEFLIREDERAESGRTTPDCRSADGKCTGCGVSALLAKAC